MSVIDEIKEMSERHQSLTGEIIDMIESEDLTLSDEVKLEVTKLNINTYLILDFVKQIKEAQDILQDKSGVLILRESEKSDVAKCVRTLVDAKKELLKSSISLELH